MSSILLDKIYGFECIFKLQQSYSYFQQDFELIKPRNTPEGEELFESDILLTKDQWEAIREWKASNYESLRWPEDSVKALSNQDVTPGWFTNTESPTQKPTKKPTTKKPTQKPTKKPTTKKPTTKKPTPVKPTKPTKCSK